ncbi:jg15315 [Pararge aegeria aegeria]|uniref:Jg15315 protein n=1 Tax=Pararge aegeria aegeria TaxID=348720 RepID=A0A8S4R6T7_9NEOP|nr:jg15315 [Pararge aegeria aegeria]
MITGHCQLNKHLFILGITNSPLCRACMEADETPTRVLLRCRGIAQQRATYLGSPASLPEALGDLGGLLSFWSDTAGSRTSGTTYKGKEGSGRPSTETSPEKEEGGSCLIMYPINYGI